MEVNPQEIAKQLQQKNIKNLYLLYGDESYYIDWIEKKFAESYLTDEEKEFDLEILYGKDSDLIQLVNSAKQFPLIGSRRIIILREAQHIKKWDELVLYFHKPAPQTTIVIAYKGGKIHQAQINKITKAYPEAVLMYAKKMYDNQLPNWIEQSVKQYQRKISPLSAQLLADFLGNDLSKIDNELKKMFISLPEGGEVTTEIIEKNIGVSKEFSVFELNSAVARRDIDKANKIAFYFANNNKNHPLAFTLIQLYNLFANFLVLHMGLKENNSRAIAALLKINPFFTKDYEVGMGIYNRKKVAQNIHLIAVYDLKYKGVNNVSTDEGILLKELVYQLMH